MFWRIQNGLLKGQTEKRIEHNIFTAAVFGLPLFLYSVEKTSTIQFRSTMFAAKNGADVQLLVVFHAGKRECVVRFTHNALLLSFFEQKKTVSASKKANTQSFLFVI